MEAFIPPKSTRLKSHVLWENPTLEIDLSITIFISCKQPHKATHQIVWFLIMGEDFCLSSSSSNVVDIEMHHPDPSSRKCLPFSCRDASATESSCQRLRGLPGLASGPACLPRSWARWHECVEGLAIWPGAGHSEGSISSRAPHWGNPSFNDLHLSFFSFCPFLLPLPSFPYVDLSLILYNPNCPSICFLRTQAVMSLLQKPYLKCDS